MHSEHVNSSIKRCDIAHDTSRLRQAGVRKCLVEVCCALHSFVYVAHPGNYWFG
ncbi:MAG TPA: hypothetical protein VI542_37670 [Candidatus Tectomicrobia bacterium]